MVRVTLCDRSSHLAPTIRVDAATLDVTDAGYFELRGVETITAPGEQCHAAGFARAQELAIDHTRIARLSDGDLVFSREDWRLIVVERDDDAGHLAELRSDYARALAGDESVRSEYPLQTIGAFGNGSERPSLTRIMQMCREAAKDLGASLPTDAEQQLYARADALGLPYEPGFDDAGLAERVADGLCADGLVHSSVRGTYPCAGCDACTGAHVDRVIAKMREADTEFITIDTVAQFARCTPQQAEHAIRRAGLRP